MIISIYIDDCLLIANAINIPVLKQVLSNRFNLKDLGQVASILGVEVIRDEKTNSLCLCQRGHILSTLKTFQLTDNKPT
jgi:hypothetical protein